MALQTIRTENEVTERYHEAIRAGREGVEIDKYLRQMPNEYAEIEDFREIQQSAKNYLSYMLRNIGQCRWLQVRRAIQQYVAWKWMLGHADADTFPGAHNKPADHDPRQSYIYLRDQIQSGEWDRLTKQAAIEVRKEQDAALSTTTTITNDEPTTTERPNVNLATIPTPRRLWKLASPLAAVAGGYVIFGWRGAALTLLCWAVK